MKLKYLGTAAAEGFPALYCQCDACKEASLKKGKNIRTRAQALIDNQLLIDFGPDTYFHMLTHNVPLDQIHHVLVTHDHSDHFYANELIFRRKGYASKVEKEPLIVYGDKAVYDSTINVIKQDDLQGYIEAHLIELYKPFKVLNYTITALRANHDEKATPVLYLIDDGMKCMLYAHDTGFFPQETKDYLKNLKKPLDLISLDCTAGILKGWGYGHLSFDCFLQVIEDLKKDGAIDEHTKIIANHFSHNGLATYDKMKQEAKPYHVDVSYDGMEIDI